MSETPQPVSPSRQLVLHVMLSLLASAGVFVVVAYLVLVPQMAQQEKRLRDLEAQVTQLQQELAEASAEPPAAPATPAIVPAVAK